MPRGGPDKAHGPAPRISAAALEQVRASACCLAALGFLAEPGRRRHRAGPNLETWAGGCPQRQPSCSKFGRSDRPPARPTDRPLDRPPDGPAPHKPDRLMPDRGRPTTQPPDRATARPTACATARLPPAVRPSGRFAARPPGLIASPVSERLPDRPVDRSARPPCRPPARPLNLPTAHAQVLPGPPTCHRRTGMASDTGAGHMKPLPAGSKAHHLSRLVQSHRWMGCPQRMRWPQLLGGRASGGAEPARTARSRGRSSPKPVEDMSTPYKSGGDAGGRANHRARCFTRGV